MCFRYAFRLVGALACHKADVIWINGAFYWHKWIVHNNASVMTVMGNIAKTFNAVFSVFTESLSVLPPIGKILFRNLFFKWSPLLLYIISLSTTVLFTNLLFTTSSFKDLSFAKLLFTPMAILSQPPSISLINSKPLNLLKLGLLKLLFIGLSLNISSKLFCSHIFSEVFSLCCKIELLCWNFVFF